MEVKFQQDSLESLRSIKKLENPSTHAYAYLLSKESRTCGICGGPLRFFLRVQAPISDKIYKFDRTLVVFMCPSMACLLEDQHRRFECLEDQHRRFECLEDQRQSRSVKVYRCQIPRKNGSSTFDECKKTADEMNEMENALLDYFKVDEDKNCNSFQDRILGSPDQVIRYSLEDQEAEQLSLVSSYLPSTEDIPKCNYCNGTLCLELQILPQLIYEFCTIENEEDPSKWATIGVYTCCDSCHSSVTYKKEFALVQLCSTTTTSTLTTCM